MVAKPLRSSSPKGGHVSEVITRMPDGTDAAEDARKPGPVILEVAETELSKNAEEDG
jgi:hypothetical protein